jgi:hypothetical protein
MARHAIVDLAQVFSTPPRKMAHDRLPPAELERLRAHVASAGFELPEGSIANQKLGELRRMYEPHVASLAGYLQLAVPTWIPDSERKDNWQTSAWERISAFQEEHF